MTLLYSIVSFEHFSKLKYNYLTFKEKAYNEVPSTHSDLTSKIKMPSCCGTIILSFLTSRTVGFSLS